MNTRLMHLEITTYFISRICEFTEGKDEGESEGKDKGSRVHCYSAVVECTGRVHWQERLCGLRYAVLF